MRVLKLFKRLVYFHVPAPRLSILLFTTSLLMTSMLVEKLAKAELEGVFLAAPGRQEAIPMKPVEPEADAPFTGAAPDITRGSTWAMEAAFTFDGGGVAGEAGFILDVLKEKGVKATIFLTGDFIRDNPAIARRIALEGHEAANHTMTHPHLTDFSNSLNQSTAVDRAVLSEELRGAEELYMETTGFEMAPLWRAPYGEVNREILNWAYDEGFIHVGWSRERGASLDTLDWVSDRRSPLYRTPREIKERVLNFGRGGVGLRGGIVLMHLGTDRKTEKASESLGALIDGLRERGYRLVKVSEMIEGQRAYAALQERRARHLARIASAYNTEK